MFVEIKLLTVVYLMSVQSAFFGPSKYSLLPEMLPESKLSWGNGILSLGTFMAINGDGFFVVQKPDNFVDNNPVFAGIENYTRRGDFQVDKNGYLVNGAGYYLMGIPVDSTTGNLVGSVLRLDDLLTRICEISAAAPAERAFATPRCTA